MEVSKNELNEHTVYLDDDDICFDCTNRYGCPLIECLNLGLVKAEEDITVKECELYNN